MSRCLLFLAVLFPILLSAQSLFFKNLSVEQGLPSAEVHHIMQDSKGYLWFSTNNGVSKYDGYQFKNFGLEKGLQNNLVFESKEDHLGRIWFRSLTGNFSYHQNDSIKVFQSEPKLSTILKEYNIPLSFYINKENQLWIGTLKNYYVFDIATGNIMPTPENPSSFYTLKQIDSKGFIYYSNVKSESAKNLLSILDSANTLITVIFDGPRPPGSVMRSLKLSNGNILYSCDNVLWEVSSKKHVLKHSFTRHAITALYEDHEGDIWVGLKNNGVMFFRGGDLAKTPECYLPENTITSVTQDNEGAYWFSSLENGVFYLYSKHLVYFDKTNGLPNNKIRLISPLHDKSMVLAINNFLTIIRDHTVTNINLEIFFGKDYVMESLLVHPDNTLYVGGTQHGIVKFSGKSKPVKIVLKELINVKNIIRSKTGHIMCCTPTTLFIIKGEKIVERYPITSRATCLFETRTGKIFIGCVDGLMEFTGKSIKPVGEINNLLALNIVAIAELEDNLLLATKNNGLLKVNMNTFSDLTRLNTESNICNSVFVDDTGIIWVATNSGIARISERGNQPYTTTFNIGNGLIANQIDKISILDSVLYAATSKGLLKIPVSSLRVNPADFPVYITGLHIFNKEYSVKDSLSLSHRQNYITINYGGISYASMNNLQYKFKLEGVDSTWKYTGNTSIQYPTLPPGNYKFTVYAINNNNIESTFPATLIIAINAPFWKKWWFNLIAAGLLLALLFFTFGLRVRYLRKRDAVKKRIAEIEMKALRSQMNPHFIFNCLGSIQNFILKNDSESAERYLNKFSRLIRSVLESSAHPTIILQDEMDMLRLYIELESIRFKNRFDYKIEIREEINPANIIIPTMLIQPYVENAIWHGLMPKESTGSLKIWIGKKKDCLKCIIEDTGIGRKRSEEINAERKTHTSFGMAVTHERVEILNIQNRQKSSVQINDITNDIGIISGTCVEIVIPLHYTYDKSDNN